MLYDSLINNINDIEKQISELPVGWISEKTVNGKTYYYHCWTQKYENGKSKKAQAYVNFADVEQLRTQIEQRKALEAELKKLKKKIPTSNVAKPVYGFNSNVIVGESLRKLVLPVKNYKKREIFSELNNFVYGDIPDRVFILYGLRRTGKTTMIRQIISDMSEADFAKSAFIQISSGDTLAAVNKDLKQLETNGYKYIFIDEVTFLEDFIEGAALFSDIYATCGMKIVLSGTDSLGFMFSKSDQLYDRCILLHTTFIPYREFENVLGIKGIDRYIQYGGTMSLSGVNYNIESAFLNEKTVNDYIDSAIAKNIQHSLKYYQDGGHFRHLIDLYDKGELTSAINRVVEDINHRFTVDVLTRDFISNDLSISARNLRRDRNNPTTVLDDIDRPALIERLKKALEILNRQEQSIQVDELHAVEIKEYLKLLDLVYDIDKRSFPNINAPKSITVISQSGMRYAQAKALVTSLMSDNTFNDLSIVERNAVIDRILSEIKGRMMEDIVLLETKLAYPEKNIFKLEFPVGEFDMVVCDERAVTCEIFEIKYSTEAVVEQTRHLVDEEKCQLTERQIGKITGKCVIYRGDTQNIDGIKYINVEEYLRNL